MLFKYNYNQRVSTKNSTNSHFFLSVLSAATVFPGHVYLLDSPQWIFLLSSLTAIAGFHSNAQYSWWKSLLPVRHARPTSPLPLEKLRAKCVSEQELCEQFCWGKQREAQGRTSPLTISEFFCLWVEWQYSPFCAPLCLVCPWDLSAGRGGQADSPPQHTWPPLITHNSAVNERTDLRTLLVICLMIARQDIDQSGIWR